MRVAIIHYWLNGMRGGEKVLENICSIYPNADIYTHVLDRAKISNKINSHKIFTTFINYLPFSKKLQGTFVAKRRRSWNFAVQIQY